MKSILCFGISAFLLFKAGFNCAIEDPYAILLIGAVSWMFLGVYFNE